MDGDCVRRIALVGLLLMGLGACAAEDPGDTEADTTTTDVADTIPMATTTAAPETTQAPQPLVATTARPTPTTTAAPATTAAPPTTAGVYYANCDEARAAGAAPISRGEPGYRSALDRDGDGVACDK